jgi:hypothetical protein
VYCMVPASGWKIWLCRLTKGDWFDDPLTLNSDYMSDEGDWFEESSVDAEEINDRHMN